MAIKGYVIDLSSVTEFPVEPQITVPWYANTTAILSDHPSAIIYASLSGTTDDASINSARVAGVQLASPLRQMWLRREPGEVSPETVTVRVTLETAPE